MSTTLEPRTAAELAAAVAESSGPLEIIGAGSKRGLGRPVNSGGLLDLSRLSGIILYEPEELVLTAGAGTPLAEIERALAARKQMLAFEPPDLGPLYGRPAGQGTLGGMLACNLAGPRRPKAGAARDHFLGALAVNGQGEIFKTGGRVVKNVTGYDLCKLLAGSWGTLAVMTEVTLKVMPKPEGERTLVLRALDDLAANQAMTVALGSPFDVSGAAHVPASALRSEVDGLDRLGSPREAVTLLRLEGTVASATHRAAALAVALKGFGEAQVVEDAESAEIWSSVRDVQPLAAKGPLGVWPVWRIVCPPASGGALGQALARQSGGDVIYDWGGGLIWAALPPGADALAPLVRQRVAAVGGHAMLLRAGEEVRRQIDVFHPLPAGLAGLSERVRASFDPKAILNRGRMMRGPAT